MDNGRPRLQPGQEPYRGLLPYRPADAQFFAGRDDLVRTLVSRAVPSPHDPIALVGPAGSGKSSLVLAGLVPALDHNRGIGGWLSVRLLRPGAGPLWGLAAALAGPAAASVSDLRDRLLADPEAVCGVLESIVTTQRPGQRRLVIIEQFEEAITDSGDPVERRQFLATLLAAGRSASVVLCIRANTAPLVPARSPLASILQQAILVQPMGDRQLQQVIAKPAQAAGGLVDPALVDHILAERGSLNGSVPPHDRLPLLSHALRATWFSSPDRRLTVQCYQAVGGLSGALAQTAERVWRDLPSHSHRRLARAILISLGIDNGMGVRSATPVTDVLARGTETRLVLDRFRTDGLISSGETSSQKVNPVLARAWPRLRRWLEVANS